MVLLLLLLLRLLLLLLLLRLRGLVLLLKGYLVDWIKLHRLQIRRAPIAA